MNIRYSKPTFIVVTITFLLSCCGCLSTDAQFKLHNMSANYYFSDAIQIDLAKSIERGNVIGIEKLITEGADVNAIGKYDIRPLFWAFSKREIESFRVLLENGADPNFYMMDTDDIPHQVKPSLMENLVEVEAIEYLELVLQHGGDPNFLVESFYPSGRLSSSESIIYSAIMGNRFDNVQMLVRYGADLDYRDFSGYTPSMDAASIDRFEMVFYFLEQGADPTIKSNSGFDLIDDIMEYGCFRIDPKGQQYGWCLKVVDRLKNRSLVDQDYNPSQPSFTVKDK